MGFCLLVDQTWELPMNQFGCLEVFKSPTNRLQIVKLCIRYNSLEQFVQRQARIILELSISDVCEYFVLEFLMHDFVNVQTRIGLAAQQNTNFTQT